MTSVSADDKQTPAVTDHNRLGFGHRLLRPDLSSQALLWIGGTVIALLLAVTTGLVYSLREDALNRVESNLATTSFMLADTLDRALQTIDMTLTETALAVTAGSSVIGAADVGAASVESIESRRDWLRSKIARLPMVQRLSFSDATGRVVATSQDWVLTKTSVSDRSYFALLRDGPDQGAVISEPIQSRADGQWTFIVARRISGADGAFIGAVWTTINLDVLGRLFAASAPEAGARVTLLRNDLIMLVRYHFVPNLYGRVMTFTPTIDGIFGDGKSVGSGRYYSYIESRSQVAAGRRLTHYPLAVSITVPEATVLAPWYQLATGIGTAAGGLAIGLTALFWALYRQQLKLQAGATALAESETGLRNERSRLSSVVDVSNDGFWEWDAGTGMIDWSERCCLQMGLPAAGGVLHFEQIIDMIMPEDRERYRAAVRGLFNQNQPFTIEARWRGFDGGVRWIESRGRLIRDAQGQPTRMVGANTDITERKLIESCLTPLDAAE